MNIFFLSTGISYGGAYKVFTWLMNSLAASGNRVTLLTYRTDKSVSYQLIDNRVRRLHLPLESNGGSIYNCIMTAAKLREHIQHEAYDIGIAFLPPAQVRLILACKGTGTKVLISQRGDPWNSPLTNSRYIPDKLINWVLSFADAHVFQTVHAQNYYSQSVKKKSVVIPNPVIPLLRSQSRKPEKRIVNVARLVVKQKRQDILIRAFNMIAPQFPEYCLEIYGSGPDQYLLESLAKGNPRIKFMGITTNIVESIQNASMFVLSSDYEGIPNVLLEAMSLGVPCISTRYSPGGVEQLINNNNNGLLVDRGDALTLAKRMEEFLTDVPLAESCGLQAKSITKFFNEYDIANKWTNYLHDLCS